MKLRKSTRHALHAALELALARERAAGDGLVTAAEVAGRYALPPAVVAKIFQRLAQAGLAVGTRGVAGGYRLARPAAAITLLEILEAFERAGAERRSAAAPLPTEAERRLRELFAEIDEQSRATFASVTLETLVRPRAPLRAVGSRG